MYNCLSRSVPEIHWVVVAFVAAAAVVAAAALVLCGSRNVTASRECISMTDVLAH